MHARACAYLAAALCALVAPAAASAETVINNTGTPVNVVDNGKASPYPAEITINGADGPITDVNVNLTISHTQPDDLDMMIVSPEGDAVRLMVDACGAADFVSTFIVIDDEAATELPANNCVSGTFRPTVPGSAFFPAPAPGGSGFELSGMDGGDPNGRWQLYVYDDRANDVGSIGAWGLTITTTAGEVVIPAGPATSGIAGPYPSIKNVPTPDGEVISDVTLATTISHTFPADVDMLLQGPGGQSVMLMSDACSDADFHARDTQFSDDGGLLTESNSLDCLQLFLPRPIDFGTPEENLPDPAPPRPYATALSVFDGLSASDWRLWVSDDTNGDTGYLTAWVPVLTTRPAASTGFTAPSVSAAEGQTATLTVTRSGPVDLGPATLDVGIAHSGTDAADIGTVPAQLQFARGEASKTIAIPINSDFEGEGAEDFVVSLTNPVDDALLADATSSAVVTIGASPPDNRFTVGEVKRLRNGSATVEVTIPNPGTLASDDAGSKDQLKPVETDASNAGKQIVKVKPAKKAKRKLRRGQKIRLTAEITYTPYDGLANSAEAPVTLKKKR